jgi:N-acetylated-alpha-linked acidic dipeptidase
MLAIVGAAAVAVAGLVTVAGWQRPSPSMFGFTRPGAVAEAALERRFLSLQDTARIGEEHAVLSSEPHLAGSRRDYELTLRTRDRFLASGLEQVEITTHDVLLPWPQEVLVEMTRPVAWRATMHDKPRADDPSTSIAPAEAGIPYHAYSASGEVTAPLVDAGDGAPADYDDLRRRGLEVRGRIVLVRNSGPYSYRGSKVFTAEQRGASAILIDSGAPADDPTGPSADRDTAEWLRARIERGGVSYDFMVPGDPLTPGWASVPGARRLDPADAASLPKIISVPLSHEDAAVIRGTSAPIVHVRVRIDRQIRPVWTVTGMIHGTDRPDELVIVGNHRDAWVYGGVDPSSGTAALLELARTLGALTRAGWRPRRSILLASWDAEEFAITSSTEWGEQHADTLSQSAVAYVNVDSAASGARFTATAVPSLNRVIAEAAQAVQDPSSRTSVAAAARDRRARDAGVLATGTARDLVDNRVGSGSDYTVFLNHVGIPIADLSFTGPYGVYHSLYDTHAWVARVADPGFRYHAALVQLWGVLTLRLADSDALPLDYEEYADSIAVFINEVQQQPVSRASTAAFEEMSRACQRMRRAAVEFGRTRDQALARNDRAALGTLDRKVLRVERALIDPDGIPGRPWYRHVVYAPAFTYAPEVLPAVSEAIAAHDPARLGRQAHRLVEAMDRATRELQ